MKRPTTPRLFLLIAATFLTLPTDAAIIRNKAVVRSVRDGSADISQDNGKTWKPTLVGMRLGENGVIRTGNTATVDLFLGENGPVVRVTKSTTLGIDKLDYENTGIEKVIETQLNLKEGRIVGVVKKMAASSKYEVKFPAGVAGIRGTEYSISSKGEIKVFSGTVIPVFTIGHLDLLILTANYQIAFDANGTPHIDQIAPNDPVRLEFVELNPGPVCMCSALPEELYTKPFPDADPAVHGSFDITRPFLTEIVPVVPLEEMDYTHEPPISLNP